MSRSSSLPVLVGAVGSDTRADRPAGRLHGSVPADPRGQ